MSTSRDRILGRIRDALASQKEHHAEVPEVNDAVLRQLPKDLSPAERRAEFEGRIQELGDSYVCVDGWSAARDWLLDFLRKSSATPVLACADNKAIEMLEWKTPIEDAITLLTAADTAERSFACTHGITMAEAGVAETGTIVVASGAGKLRLASLAPEVHIVLLPESRLVSDIADVIANHPGPEHAVTTWITGSSRTADIDGILIHGAHGPRELIVILVREEAV
ncbi:lactate utilization protein [bacterium]|nr:lactate utilization protein [bacterium]